MSAIKSIAIILAVVVTSGFAAPTFAQKNQNSSEQINSSTIQKSNKDVKPAKKETTPQQKCKRYPFCW